MAQSTVPAGPAAGATLRDRLQPTEVNATVRATAWLLLIANSAIIVTGALVRLTGSGLGCDNWPTCNGVTIAPAADAGIHGAIEFGNRLLGVVLFIICLVAITAVWRLRRTRKDLFWLPIVLTLVVPVQAVIGGISVHMELNPWIVAAHFVPSAVCVALSAYLVLRTHDAGGPTEPVGTALLRGLQWAIGILTALTVVLGVLVTGAGPHAGDAISARNGLPMVIIARMHAFPVWLLVIATVWGLVLSTRLGLVAVRRALWVMLAAEVVQGLIGYLQYFLGVPVALVALHIVGLCFVIAAATAVTDSAYRRAPLPR
ncbi:COX15/CtaA family protein [Brevibacterium sp. 50QC2O2]|uniref:COX15/CtaA family protein n=1 Tax=Brevibacterium TaxID=1696 RepID=UPI00211C4D6A|nr:MULTISPECIES: COX15/CtaA family protein [unclassified Brevibacterium]MCQ9366703.1 COX15/CtaA family protein [Brevibacterium sp. 91QC2O2]MCQ9384320.1 COX15/CtaA family protein [Brevibacterium sp. 68QC2CO]MCQ9388939.1 COX15/CtaA family protein [Brevibacterium sp. 50QC2O2]